MCLYVIDIKRANMMQLFSECLCFGAFLFVGAWMFANSVQIRSQWWRRCNIRNAHKFKSHKIDEAPSSSDSERRWKWFKCVCAFHLDQYIELNGALDCTLLWPLRVAGNVLFISYLRWNAIVFSMCCQQCRLKYCSPQAIHECISVQVTDTHRSCTPKHVHAVSSLLYTPAHNAVCIPTVVGMTNQRTKKETNDFKNPNIHLGCTQTQGQR